MSKHRIVALKYMLTKLRRGRMTNNEHQIADILEGVIAMLEEDFQTREVRQVPEVDPQRPRHNDREGSPRGGS